MFWMEKCLQKIRHGFLSWFWPPPRPVPPPTHTHTQEMATLLKSVPKPVGLGDPSLVCGQRLPERGQADRRVAAGRGDPPVAVTAQGKVGDAHLSR